VSCHSVSLLSPSQQTPGSCAPPRRPVARCARARESRAPALVLLRAPWRLVPANFMHAVATLRMFRAGHVSDSNSDQNVIPTQEPRPNGVLQTQYMERRCPLCPGKKLGSVAHLYLSCRVTSSLADPRFPWDVFTQHQQMTVLLGTTPQEPQVQHHKQWFMTILPRCHALAAQLTAWWVGLAPITLEFWVRFPNERNQGKQAHPVLKYRVLHGSHSFFHTISLSPAFTRVRDGQTSPHRPRLVVSRSTCPPLSSPPHSNSFVIGPTVIKHTLTLTVQKELQISAKAGMTAGQLRATFSAPPAMVGGVRIRVPSPVAMSTSDEE